MVGSLQISVGHIAKAIQPERLKFWDVPTFDPVPYLDSANQATFLRPLLYAEEVGETSAKIPKVRMRMREKDKLRFLALLDSTQRLAFAKPSEVREGVENGAFAVPKDRSRDRMVLDARPANCLEVPETRWIRSLGSVSQFQHFFRFSW